VAYDNPIPGFKTNNTINLRLWAAKPDREFDLEAFNTGDYVQVSHSLDPEYRTTSCLKLMGGV
jgi:glucan phosphorylase